MQNTSPLALKVSIYYYYSSLHSLPFNKVDHNSVLRLATTRLPIEASNPAEYIA